MTKLRVKDKVALITGAAAGIGKATAELLAQEGAYVILSDICDQLGSEVAKTIGDKAVYWHLDVSKEEEWQKIIQLAEEKYGRLNILVNNAGITGISHTSEVQDPEHTSLKSWHHIHAINLDGVFLGCKYGIQLMKKQGGSIINLSSRSGLVGIPTAVAYASSKAAVRNHSKSVALYCADKNYRIRCNSLHPAAILTPLWDSMLGEESNRNQMIEEIARNIPLKRMGEPKDVAYAVLYLASDESSYITGTELTIDGGILAGSAASPKSD